MSENPRDLNSPLPGSSIPTGATIDFDRRRTLGGYFRAHRLESKISESEIASALELPSLETVMAYESGRLAIPLEDVYALTNLLNLAPEDVMDLIHGLYNLGAD